jgi:cation diffusion facilitator family transporter
VSHASSTRAILYAFLANLGIAIAKSGAAVYTASGSMLAEAIHSYADCGNQVLLYIGLRQSERPADREHPMGYGKITYFWSFIVAVLLFSMGGLFSMYEGWHKLHQPEPLHQAWIALVVLGVSIILEVFSLLGALREIRTLRGERRFGVWLKQTRNAELVVVLGEDIAAITGLILAFVFVSITAITGNAVWDAAGSICIGVILIIVSLFISLRIRGLITGRSADPELEASIRNIITEDDNIEMLFHAITLQFGPHVMLAAKIRMKAGLSIETAVMHINLLEQKIKAAQPTVRWCFIEPDDVD